MMEGGNRCHGSTAMTAISIRKIACTVFKLAMMDLCECLVEIHANQETWQSDRRPTAFDDQTPVAAGQGMAALRVTAARGRFSNKSSLMATRATTAKK
ncbi:hypothetical protein MRX96_051715 [Rhipicephalus microplus]